MTTSATSSSVRFAAVEGSDGTASQSHGLHSHGLNSHGLHSRGLETRTTLAHYNSEQMMEKVISVVTELDLRDAERHRAAVSAGIAGGGGEQLSFCGTGNDVFRHFGAGVELHFRMTLSLALVLLFPGFAALYPAMEYASGESLKNQTEWMGETLVMQLAKTAVANIGQPDDRNQDTAHTAMKEHMFMLSMLDAFLVLFLLGWTLYYRNVVIPSVVRMQRAEVATPEDWSIYVDCLPRRLNSDKHYQYANELRWHFERQLEEKILSERTPHPHIKKQRCCGAVTVDLVHEDERLYPDVIAMRTVEGFCIRLDADMKWRAHDVRVNTEEGQEERFSLLSLIHHEDGTVSIWDQSRCRWLEERSSCFGKTRLAASASKWLGKQHKFEVIDLKKEDHIVMLRSRQGCWVRINPNTMVLELVDMEPKDNSKVFEMVGLEVRHSEMVALESGEPGRICAALVKTSSEFTLVAQKCVVALGMRHSMEKNTDLVKLAKYLNGGKNDGLLRHTLSRMQPVSIQGQDNKVIPDPMQRCVELVKKHVDELLPMCKQNISNLRTFIKLGCRLPDEPLIHQVALVRDYGGGLNFYKAQHNAKSTIVKQKVKSMGREARANIELEQLMEEAHVEYGEDVKENIPVVFRDVIGAFLILTRADNRDWLLHDYRFSRTWFRRLANDERRFFKAPIRVDEAPSPSDILWTNMDYKPRKRRIRKGLTYLASFGIVIGCIALLSYLRRVQEEFKAPPGLAAECGLKCDCASPGVCACTEDAHEECECILAGYSNIMLNATLITHCGTFLDNKIRESSIVVASAGTIALVGLLIPFVNEYLAQFGKPSSVTQMNVQIMAATFFFRVLNSAMITVLINADFQEERGVGRITIPIIGKEVTLFGSGQFKDLVPSWYLVAGTVIMLTFVSESLVGSFAGAQAAPIFYLRRKFLAKYQTFRTDLIELFTPPDFPFAVRAAQALAIAFVGIAFSSMFPIFYLIASVGMFNIHVVDKMVFLHGSKVPPRYSHHLANFFIQFLEIAILLHGGLGVYAFSVWEAVPSHYTGNMGEPDQSIGFETEVDFMGALKLVNATYTRAMVSDAAQPQAAVMVVVLVLYLCRILIFIFGDVLLRKVILGNILLVISTLAPNCFSATRDRLRRLKGMFVRVEKADIKHDAYFLAPMHEMKDKSILSSYDLSDTHEFKFLPDSNRVWTTAWINILQGDDDLDFSQIHKGLLDRYGAHLHQVSHQVKDMTKTLSKMAIAKSGMNALSVRPTGTSASKRPSPAGGGGIQVASTRPSQIEKE
eukprot:TRINITY_DN91833_c0_g1_i1.p1 TRINITY_DN91833_c0_g1~~TRINITY_DN91833_c0_g1_i1.p1  ORF type:complete len:1282 (-),score=324.89 TRINITY_DN91833_c0_g1_i1:168-4013(-)